MNNLIKINIDHFPNSEFKLANGQVDYITGWAFCIGHRIKFLNIIIDDIKKSVFHYGEPRPDIIKQYNSNGITKIDNCNIGFTTLLEIPDKVGKYSVFLESIIENGESVINEIHKINVTDYDNLYYSIMKKIPDSEVCICMATFNPNINLFKKQIESIKYQTFIDWTCIINDDGSDLDCYLKMNDIISTDQRFHIFKNPNNLGFYRNFEKCLQFVPPLTKYVALSDQDDYWHTKKLEKLLELIKRKKSSLAYSDVRIVDAEGKVLHTSYWNWRKNNFTDPVALWLANTVTGSTSIFNRDLLNIVLPFPIKISPMYHDWWIALSAICSDGISYEPYALHDYTQHGNNIIGYQGGSLNKPNKIGLKPRIKKSILNFNNDVLRLFLIAKTLHKRLPNSKTARKLSRIFPNNSPSLMHILLKIPFLIKGMLRRRLTVKAEERLLFSIFCMYIAKIYFSNKKYIGFDFFKTNKSANISSIDQLNYSISQITLKCAKITFNLNTNNETVINLVIPTIYFSIIFGGYLGKFALASRFLDMGYKVRILIIDKCIFDLELWKSLSINYSALNRIFDETEIINCYDRNIAVDIGPNHRFIATTWWTAIVIGESLKKYCFPPFLYLIQEFEPLTFNNGSWHAMASSSYYYPHVAIFSTSSLMEYFQQHRIGVFSNSMPVKYFVFNNAISKFKPSLAIAEKRIQKKLLIYLRPESHASRNLCELSLISLNQAILEGAFADQPWEFWGIGSSSLGNQISLACGKIITLLPKMNLSEYEKCLTNFDLGISLMYTPHPSLVPIEMCSAGLICITTIYENKTESELLQISKNFIPAEPIITSIVSAIKMGVVRSFDYRSRIENAKLSWPTDWKVSFSDSLMKDVVYSLGLNN